MDSEEETEEGAEQPEGKKSYWWLTLCLLLVFLAGGGYLALKAMRQSAQKLAGVETSSLSADSAVYGGETARGKADNVFASDEPAPAAKEGGSALNEKLKPGWVKEMAAEAAAKGAASQAATPQGPQAGENAQDSRPQAAARQGGGSMADRLQSKASLGGRSGASASKTEAPSQVEGFQANGATAGKPAIQKETRAAAPAKGGGGGVLSALKGAFRASFYGARVASQDAAKGWIARSFDASPEAETSIKYDEKMKAKLDVVNPNSIPKFLRDQDVSAAEAKTLPTSQVADPSIDKESTKDSLAADKSYQAKKAAGDLAGSVINPMFAGVGGSRSPDATNGDGGDQYRDPQAAADLRDIAAEEYVSVNGFGGECGCSKDAPCCCLPKAGAGDSCGMDAGAGAGCMWAGSDNVDLGGGGDGTMWV